MPTKPHLTFDQQLDKLISRGMIIDNRASALHYLTHINYYRLRGYWLPFEIGEPTNNDIHHFIENTTFKSVLSLYIFDRELRTLCMDAIERIEISIRSQWAYHLTIVHGSCAYLDKNHYNFRAKISHTDVLTKTKKEFMRSKEKYAVHYRNKSSNPLKPDYNIIPAWVICETMSLGSISKWYGGIRYRSIKQRIAKTYNLDERVLTSYLHHLAVFRNICAHHLRLWNKKFIFEFKRPIELIDNFNHYNEEHELNYLNRKVYNTLTMLNYILGSIAPNNSFKHKLKILINKYDIQVKHMGFPKNWQSFIIWT